ncbi:hypothetical protein ACIQ7N_01735 [Lysinibacillus sp. NPDC095746]|uniref:hypothetical protein n=1 Tax=Lysinibacillus sp. NPDC095746 TaxID=3364134 RepID=UPI003818AAC7
MFMLNVYKYSNENLKKAISLAINNQITHKELVDWCFHYLNDVYFKDDEDNPLDDRATKIVLDIDTQWEIYISNTFALSELQTLEFETVKMPIEWLKKWFDLINY